MKENRISLLLLLSISLLLLAFVILFIWGFIYYQNTVKANPPAVIVIKDSSGILKRRDSMQTVFSSTINKINATLDSTKITTDSVQVNMAARLKEFYSLKSEIDQLYDTKLSPAQLEQAREKLAALQKRTDEWRVKYAEVTEENKRLSTMLASMNESKRIPEPLNNSRSVSESARIVPKPVINSSTTLSVSDIQLKAITEDSKRETYQASHTGQFQGSFNIQANSTSRQYDEIYVVLQQPDGRVLTQSVWDSGSFETKDGRKIYSYKLRFDYQQGENKRLHFYIEATQFQKGTYTMQVYHKGVLLARTTKSLS